MKHLPYLLFCMVLLATVSAEINQDLLLYYPLDSDTIYDASGNNRTGQNSGTTDRVGVLNRGRLFTSTDSAYGDYIRTKISTTPIHDNSNITISKWIQVKNITYVDNNYDWSVWEGVEGGDGGGSEEEYNEGFLYSGGVNYYLVYYEGIGQILYPNIQKGVWYHMAVTIEDDSSMSLWVNGVYYATVTGTASKSSTWERIVIGRPSLGIIGNTRAWNGGIDEFLIHTRVLTQAEIQQLAELPPTPSAGGPIFNYYEDFEDHNQTTVSIGSQTDITYTGTIGNPSLRMYSGSPGTAYGGSYSQAGRISGFKEPQHIPLALGTYAQFGRIEATSTRNNGFTTVDVILPQSVFINDNFKFELKQLFWETSESNAQGYADLNFYHGNIRKYRLAMVNVNYAVPEADCTAYQLPSGGFNRFFINGASISGSCSALNDMVFDRIVIHNWGMHTVSFTTHTQYFSVDNINITWNSNFAPSILFTESPSTVTYAGATNYIDGTASDTENDLVYYAVDCDYPNGGNVPFGLYLHRQQCTYTNLGDYTIAYYVTDNVNGPTYSSPTLFSVSVIDYICSDGLDNDGDGLTDYPSDTGCASASDTNERGSDICDDGTDNDGDTFSDYPLDTGCTSPTDISELGNDECDDGTDNDGDGFTDFPDDSGCSSTLDDTESDLVPTGEKSGGAITIAPPIKEECVQGVIFNYGEPKQVIDYKNIEVPYYVTEKVSADTCGVDANQDGIKCDLNEDFISCSKDCNFNLAELVCIHSQRCMWTESWAVQIIIILQMMSSLYMIYMLYLR